MKKDKTLIYAVIFLFCLIGISFLSGQLNKDNIIKNFDNIKNKKGIEIMSESKINISSFYDKIIENTSKTQ